jgi:hypothetical protein
MIIRSAALVLGLIVLGACGSGPQPSAIASGSPEAAASADPVSDGMPPGCTSIDLRAPSGEVVDLTGEWAGDGVLTGDNEVASLSQIGDCVYGTVSGRSLFGDPPGAYQVSTVLRGRIAHDFTIAFEVVVVKQAPFLGFAEYSEVPMLVDWDEDGRIFLKEDREPGITAPRCVPLSVPCLDPVLWYRVDEAPPP